MASKRWVGGTGNYADGSEWSPTGVPAPGDTAVIEAGADVILAPGTLAVPIVLADPSATLTVQGSDTVSFNPSGASLTSTGPGGLIDLQSGGILYAGGGAILGSSDPSRPLVIISQGGTLTIGTGQDLDVTGALALTGSTAVVQGTVRGFVLGGSINVQPGGTLIVSSQSRVDNANAPTDLQIASGTLDISQATTQTSETVRFRDDYGRVILENGQNLIANSFRVGDVIDVKNIQVSGVVSPAPDGTLTVGATTLAFDYGLGNGVSFTLTPDGSNGTLVTAGGGVAASGNIASSEVFGFAFTDARFAFMPGKTLLTAPNGTVTNVTGVGSLQFADGTIQARTGTIVDPVYYYAHNPDVWSAYLATGHTAAQHYDQYGWHEGRDPDALFSTHGYLAANPDVAAAGVDPALHYDATGWREGRDAGVSFSPEAYRATNPDVAAANVDPLAQYLSSGEAEGRYAFVGLDASSTIGDFDPTFYSAQNPDVVAARPNGITPVSFDLQHYLTHGAAEGRNPDQFFDTNYYLTNNPDVRASGINPLLHYEQDGWQEGRNPSAAFNTNRYLASNPDVAAAHIDPLQHYLQYGIAEGRSLG